MERVEAFVGGMKFLSVPRACPGQRRVIDYRHLLPALKRKPAAFARWRLRDEMFPRTEYRQTWERLVSELPERQACRVMIGLLISRSAVRAKQRSRNAWRCCSTVECCPSWRSW